MTLKSPPEHLYFFLSACGWRLLCETSQTKASGECAAGGDQVLCFSAHTSSCYFLGKADCSMPRNLMAIQPFSNSTGCKELLTNQWIKRKVVTHSLQGWNHCPRIMEKCLFMPVDNAGFFTRKNKTERRKLFLQSLFLEFHIPFWSLLSHVISVLVLFLGGWSELSPSGNLWDRKQI